MELALYAQCALLDRALAGLQSGRPGHLDMYLLNVAGDGAQDVFRREAEFVQTKFDRGLGTRGRSLSLINRRTTVGQMPMAARTSMCEALQDVTAKTNREEDILVLFLTSHGSKTHELTLNQNGMEMADLPAKDLEAVLCDTSIRWKVIVVSACYSGGLIAPLKDGSTMVITAARHDRTCFGCADDNDFPYVGRTFFKEGLNETADFRKASKLVAAQVREWDKPDHHSPQKALAQKPDRQSVHSPPKNHQACHPAPS